MERIYPAASGDRIAKSSQTGKKPVWITGLALAGAYFLTRLLVRNGKRTPMNHEVQNRAPAEYGWTFTKRVLIRIYEDINKDRLLALAAGVVFYGLLALFPAITALVSSYALFADPATINQHLVLLKDIIPEGAYSIIDQQISRIASSTAGNLSLAFLISLAISIWSANSGVKAIIDALNMVYGVEERRSFIWLNIVSLAFTIGTIAGLILALSGVVIVPIVMSYLPFGDAGTSVLVWLRWPTLLVLIMFALAVLYRFGPNREDARWQWISPGATFAAFAWLAGSALLSWYLSNFANYGATYGSLGAAIGLMIWLWMSAIVVLVGAELNTVIEEARHARHR